MTDSNAAPPDGSETPPDDLTLEQQLEQVEEAADAVADAINNGDTERADNILRQLETWRENLSSTLEAARSQPNPELAETLAELRTLRDELTALRTPPNPSPPPPPLDPLPPTPPPLATQTRTPPLDASQTEPPASDEQREPLEPEPEPDPESPQQKRRAI